jgi:glucuronoarabinoxylan endo-1,4-beta-xylanase
MHTRMRNTANASCALALFSLVSVLFVIGCGGGFTAPATNATTVLSSSPSVINWTDVHQEIDGFGAADAQKGRSMTGANQNFFFGTGTGQLGLSLLRVGVTDGSDDPGNCTIVSTSCAGAYVSDMQAIITNGGRVYASPWTPPAIYKTNGLATCSSNAGLIASDYPAYATWLANFGSGYNTTTTLGSTCAGDSSCNQYVGGFNWHDYDAVLTGTNTVAADPYPSAWPTGMKYWETEASCISTMGTMLGPAFCQAGFNTDMTDALDWAAVIDQRVAVDGANAWLYWWLINGNTNDDDEGLIAGNGTIAKRAYMLGQYGKFVRPGYYRIGATHLPESFVSVSAYQDLPSGSLVIVATNYSASAVSQIFNLANAPAFSVMTPWTTSASLNLAQQSNVSVSSDSFTYTLPPDSITTFVGTP